ncbi:LuxR C-terminal-related transcriptional regulator [Nocardiopsis algeriensis]|uniref:LuxR C-terminal-related transcriptional regulator n=1 Tax=Nocardiopsis algeriensis TaxID=1478215 RepID=UPI003B436948
MSATVLLVDDQPLVRAGFRMILESAPHLSVVGELSDARRAPAEAASLLPDVVLLGVHADSAAGLRAVREITGRPRSPGHRARVVVLSNSDRDEHLAEALRAGASGFLLKDMRPGELVSAVETVARGGCVVSPQLLGRLLERLAPLLPPAEARPPGPLTERENEVLRLVARGWSNAEIAEHLVLGETTVKSHVGRILTKLGLRDRVQAVVHAYESGLVRPGAGPTPR